ncbi:MAG TPA: VanZ family protein, partial [Candidatus Sumerlaeota bacterium]|nr:VanZ family protein [Candidatus Sumerlaeota bacterium]
MRHRVLHFFTHTLPPFLWAGFIFYSSTLPDTSLPLPRIIPYSDKYAHAGAYAVLCFLIARANRRDRLIVAPAACWTVAVILTSLFGAFDEWHQSFVPTRTCSIWDWAADAVGSLLAVTAWIVWKRLA